MYVWYRFPHRSTQIYFAQLSDCHSNLIMHGYHRHHLFQDPVGSQNRHGWPTLPFKFISAFSWHYIPVIKASLKRNFTPPPLLISLSHTSYDSAVLSPGIPHFAVAHLVPYSSTVIRGFWLTLQLCGGHMMSCMWHITRWADVKAMNRQQFLQGVWSDAFRESTFIQEHSFIC